MEHIVPLIERLVCCSAGKYTGVITIDQSMTSVLLLIIATCIATENVSLCTYSRLMRR